MRRLRGLGAAAAAICAAGCSSGSAESVAKAWKDKGHSVSELAAAQKPLGGGKCSAGTADGFDVTLCEFADAEAAKQAEEAGFELVGKAVGSSVAAGKMVLVIADTRKEDPSGRRLNELVKLFREKLE